MAKKRFLIISAGFLFVFTLLIGITDFTQVRADETTDIGYYMEDVRNAHSSTKLIEKNNSAPTITVLTAGLGAHAANWSNGLNSEKKDAYFVYTYDSIIKRLWFEAMSQTNMPPLMLWAEYQKKENIEGVAVKKLEEPAIEFEEYELIGTQQLQSVDLILNQHIILIADILSADASHEIAYNELHTIIDKVAYNVKLLTDKIPKLNLIGHSRGGLLNLMYTLDHPYNVDQLFSIGTPYMGTTLGELGLEKRKQYPEMFEGDSVLNLALSMIGSPGGVDCSTPEVFYGLRDRWTTEIESRELNIPVHAVGGRTTLTFLMPKDLWAIASALSSPIGFYYPKYGLIAPLAPILEPIIATIMAETTNFFPSGQEMGAMDIIHHFVYDVAMPELKLVDRGGFEEVAWENDICVDLNSQLGIDKDNKKDYPFKKYVLDYDGNYDKTKSSCQNDVFMVPHQLESRDSRFCDIVVTNIRMGANIRSEFTIQPNFQDNTCKLIWVNKEDADVIIPSTIGGLTVTSIAENAVHSLNYVKLPNTLLKIEKGAIVDCKGVLTIPESVTFIDDNAFNKCNFTHVFVDGNNLNYRSKNGVLYRGPKLVYYPSGRGETSCIIPEGTEVIGVSAFENYQTLTKVAIPGSIQKIERQAFKSCLNLTTVQGGVNVMSVGKSAFEFTPWYENPSQEFIRDNYVILGKTTINYLGAELEIQNIPEGTDTIGADTFKCNTNITKVVIPNHIKQIDDFAFYECENMQEVFLPESTKSIGSNAFMSCVNLKEVAVLSIAPPICGMLPFQCTPLNMSIYVPQLSLEQYKEGLQWEFVSKRIKTKTFTISFDPNNNEQYPEREVEYYSVLNNLPVPTKVGYIFNGWIGGNGKIYREGSVFDYYGDDTLTADWTPINYAIHYDLNGGTNHTDNPTQYNIEQSITLNAPTRENYVFQGWYLDEAFTHETTGFPVGEINEKTFYAKWLGEERVLTYVLNGITRETTINYGKSFKLDVPTEPGRYFTGWVWNNQRITDENGNSKLTMIPEDVTLTPSWEYSFILKIQGNNGSLYLSRDGLSETETSITPGKDLIVNGEYRCPHCLAAAFLQTEYGKKIGHYFTCFRDPSGTELSCWKGTNIFNTYEDNSEVVITADFDPEEYEIYLNGGIYGYESYKYQYGVDFDVFDSLSTIATRPGYSIAYWKITRYGTITDPEELQRIFKEISCKINFEKVPDLSPGVAEIFSSIEAAPEWVPNEYTMTLEYDTGAKDYRTVIFDQSFTLPTYSRFGYTFHGWVDEQGQEVKSGTWIWPCDKTFKAKTSIDEYTITYVTNGFQGTNPNPTTYTVESSFTLQPIEKFGFVFRSWKIGGVDIIQLEPGRTEDITLTADWLGKEYIPRSNMSFTKDNQNNGVIILNLTTSSTVNYHYSIDSTISQMTIIGSGIGIWGFNLDATICMTGFKLILKDVCVQADPGLNAIDINQDCIIEVHGGNIITGGTGKSAGLDGKSGLSVKGAIYIDTLNGRVTFNGGTGAQGEEGQPGGEGSKGADGAPWWGSVDASPGGKGGPGGVGFTGGHGGYGIYVPNPNIRIECNVPQNLTIVGGDGGKGGQGGIGGRGGTGGTGSDGKFMVNAGGGGAGGPGGKGGKGGKGGDGRIATIAILPEGTKTVTGQPGAGGTGGYGGAGGTGGRGGKRYTGGGYAPTGSNGSIGEAGDSGPIGGTKG